VFRFILEPLTLKAKYSWSDGSFNNQLRILGWLLPKPNKVRTNTYRAKKLVSSFTMGVERIHACPNHCTKTMRVTVVAIMKAHPMGIKGRGRVRGIVLPQ